MNIKVKILQWKEYHKNSLEGYADIEVTPPGIIIRGVRLFGKDGRQWVRYPARPVKKPDGTTVWENIISLADFGAQKRLEALIVSELKKYLNATVGIVGSSVQNEEEPDNSNEDDIPF